MIDSGGQIPGSNGKSAFDLRKPDRLPVPIVIAVPHAGRAYPRNLLSQMRFPAESQIRLEDRLIDLVGDAVSRETGAVFIKANAPRAMIDLNRAPDDMDWSMVAKPSVSGSGSKGDAQKRFENKRAGPRRTGPKRTGRRAGHRAHSGLGLVPRRLSGVGELWRRQMSEDELEARIEGVHEPYHAMLGQVLEELRDKWGTALLLDLHSMPPLGPKSEAELVGKGEIGADFVIGDRFGASCDSAMSSLVMAYLDASGSRVAHNRPYAGGYVLDRHASPARDIHALQLETCRATYLDAGLSEPGAGLDDITEKLIGLVRRLAQELTGRQTFLQAAE